MLKSQFTKGYAFNLKKKTVKFVLNSYLWDKGKMTG